MNPKKVGIAGSGIMGASLAQVYASSGYEVVLYDIIDDAIAKGKRQVEINQETLVNEDIISKQESDNIIKLISFTKSKDCFADCSLIIEAIVEKIEIKHQFWEEVSQIAPAEAILTTNTSGLPITRIAEKVTKPERFLGQHWINPPHLLPICEIIKGEKTSPEMVTKLKDIILKLGKCPVVVKDVPGFVVNRIQFSLLREALSIVEQGIATFEDVDTVLKAGMGLRYAALGPFGIADFGGLDTFDNINSYLNAELCSSKERSPVLKKMVEEGKLGVKSGQGFYDYSGDKAEKAIKNRDKMYIELAKVLYFKK
ncbi:MAG: 3-hydroxyacyl-CoA dehydrogenase family protein [Treponema sp.]|nr:3-hydroxyacyl-CoA dehydrogenase family protein [Treponema sp.]